MTLRADLECSVFLIHLVHESATLKYGLPLFIAHPYSYDTSYILWIEISKRLKESGMLLSRAN